MVNLGLFYPWLKLDTLNAFVVLAIGAFSVFSVIYSLGFMKGKAHLGLYYACIILTALVSIAAALANDLRLLVALWGFLGFTLFILMNIGDKDASVAAKKTFIIIGGSDAAMLMGIGIIYYFTRTFKMDDIQIALGGNYIFPAVAYWCIAIACFAKAGAMPLHTWVPDCAEAAPLPVVAYIVASLDKLLGIYLLARISLDTFILSPVINAWLMAIGAITIIAAVMMALVQHNIKRLLGYHSVSQVGYMVLGIGTANPIGIAGALFHMLNNAIYKQALFLTAGNVESKTGTTELDKLGGLARNMPLTYICALIASLSISGVPPFNGFVSKWMIYQGIITSFQGQTPGMQALGLACLIIAMFGSGLTLASFMKLLHAVFLGAAGKAGKQRHEVGLAMWLPCMALALLCVFFGIFAVQIPLKYFIFPAIGGVVFSGAWYAGISTLLIAIGFCVGAIIFKLNVLKPAFRQDSAFTGAETRDLIEEARVTGVDFYNTVKDYGILKKIYSRAENGAFDIYEQGKAFVFGIGKFFQYLHNGILPTYLVWTLLGMIVLFFVLVK